MIEYRNNSAITKVYLGNQEIAKVYSSEGQVWPTDSRMLYVLKNANNEVIASARCGTASAITRANVSAYAATTTSIEIGECCLEFGNKVFSGFSHVTSVTLSDGLETIGASAFFGCSSLTSLRIPDSVTSIDSGACWNCTSLSSVHMPSAMTEVPIQMFFNCYSLTDFDFSQFTSIGYESFSDCSGFTNITLPSGLTNIGGNAFINCSSLEGTTILATTPPTLGRTAFANTSTWIYVPCDSVDEYVAAWGNGQVGTISTKVREIPNSCDNLFTLKDQNNNIIGSARCGSSTAITSGDVSTYSSSTRTIEIGSCCVEVGADAFSGWTSVRTLVIEDGVETIGNGAFRGMTYLSSVTIPSSVTTFGHSVFANDTRLSSVTLSEGLEVIGAASFLYLPATALTLPSTINEIGTRAFEGSSLQSLTCLATTPPTCGGSILSNNNACIIYVPAESVSAYQQASGWSTYASRIQAIPTD